MIRLNGCGKLKNSHHFDGTFFKAHPKLINNMDTLTKILIERSVEAIIDAGLSPSDIYGTNTAVITCSSHSETETFAMNRHHHFGMLGASKTMQANRVSYILNLKGKGC
jgi:fatty acid synthase